MSDPHGPCSKHRLPSKTRGPNHQFLFFFKTKNRTKQPSPTDRPAVDQQPSRRQPLSEMRQQSIGQANSTTIQVPFSLPFAVLSLPFADLPLPFLEFSLPFVDLVTSIVDFVTAFR